MRWRRTISPHGGDATVLQVEESGTWRAATPAEQLERAWAVAPSREGLLADFWRPGDVTLPMQPRSFRDCSLYERHWVQSSRGYVHRFMPAVAAFTDLFEAVLRRPFPAFRPHPLARIQPVYYFGNHLSFVPSGTPMRAPGFTRALDYELELGVVLRAPLRNAKPDEALAAIGGFVVVNDWSARDVQRAEMVTGLGPQKAKHFCSSMSAECVDAADVLARIEALEAIVEINGRIVARTSTAGMLHRWGETLAALSNEETLLLGELIASGTLPDGSGMENGHWPRPGDQLRLRIEGVGQIEHQVLA